MNNVSISYQIRGIDELLAKFDKAPVLVGTAMDTALNKSAITIQGKIREKAPVDTGRLRNSILYMRIGTLVYAVATNAKYAVYVHEGTRPHAMPLSAIEPWAKRRGIPAGAVWQAILKRGTKANPFFKEGAEASESQVNMYFDQAIDTVLKAFK